MTSPMDGQQVPVNMYEAEGAVVVVAPFVAQYADIMPDFGYNGLGQLTRVVENELSSTDCTSGRTDCNLVTTYRYDRAGLLMALKAAGRGR